MQDPSPVNVGSIYFISYEKIVNGSNPYSGEKTETSPKIWDGVIVVNTSYSATTIPYYLD